MVKYTITYTPADWRGSGETPYQKHLASGVGFSLPLTCKLKRLVDVGEIVRVKRGVYALPEKSYHL